ncbi:unnamed protein product [Musa textilis]
MRTWSFLLLHVLLFPSAYSVLYVCHDLFATNFYVKILSDEHCYCSILLSWCKLVYYTIFSWLYGPVGSCAHLAMANSSLTRSHIDCLWKIPQLTKRVYPPCDTSSRQRMLPLGKPVRSPVIISVAQFPQRRLIAFNWKHLQMLLKY